MIIGDGIRFRAAERTDLQQFVDWLNDPEVRQYLTIYFPMSLAFEEKWFEDNLSKSPDEQALVMEVITEGGWKSIGTISLMNVCNIDREAELGLFIGEKSEWSKGYGKKALKLMLEYAFNTLNLNRVYLRVFENNLRGIRAYKATGFIEEGRMRQAKFCNGKYLDVLIMSVLRSEWQAEN
ncbi:MAG: GNAT family N-acetyltransferase [Anaerolineaceae bacterium]|nr:GNAT family N-acetyltransferase [Anaerolineaceae bacterium]